MRKATDLIDKAQPRAAQALLEALKATRNVPRIIGRDNKGRLEYEYIERPDHQIRISAAKALLAKRVPDVCRINADYQKGELVIVISEDEAKL